MKDLKLLFEKNVGTIVKSHVEMITQTYLDNGYECFLVGGPIRDLLLGLQPKDFDFASNCPLEVTKELFKDVIPTGEDHGTLTIHIDGENYEVTRYRHDVSCDGRNATIEFSKTFEEDAIRRDLTVNAIGFNPITGEIKDPTDGLNDFENKVLRFVGEAEDRIQEDQLRVLRYLRFIVRFDSFGFTPNRAELELVVKTYDSSVVSVERIYQELEGMFKIIKQNDYTKDFVATLLNDMGIFDRFIKDSETHSTVLSKMFETFDYFPLVYVMSGDNQSVKLGNEYSKLFQWFEMFQDQDFSNQMVVKDLLTETKGDFKAAERVLRYFKTFNKGNNHINGLTTLKALKNKVGTVDEEPFMITHLKVNGQDLMDRGFKGIDIGMMLKHMLEQVKEDPSLNKKETLLGLV